MQQLTLLEVFHNQASGQWLRILWFLPWGMQQDKDYVKKPCIA